MMHFARSLGWKGSRVWDSGVYPPDSRPKINLFSANLTNMFYQVIRLSFPNLEPESPIRLDVHLNDNITIHPGTPTILLGLCSRRIQLHGNTCKSWQHSRSLTTDYHALSGNISSNELELARSYI